MEWGPKPEPTDFTVWTYAYDHGGLDSVVLRVRSTEGKSFPSQYSYMFKGGNWEEIKMIPNDIPAQTNPKPLLKAPEFSAVVKGKKNSLVDYYVIAKDRSGNQAISPMMHVFVGNGTGNGGNASSYDLVFSPSNPKPSDRITFTLNRPGKLHWGVNKWNLPHSAFWPKDTVIWPDNKAVETPMLKTGDGKYQTILGPFNDPERPVGQIDAVAHFDDNSWGKDITIPLE